MGLLTQTAEPAREILGVETIDVVADRGYFKIEDIEACERAGCIPHVPRPQRGSSAREGLFRKDEFRYDAERDAYVCPAGKLLTPIRREVVEHPFGSIKQWMYQGAFLMRGLANVRAEFSLTALAYNLRRALNILGVEAMTAAVVA